MLKNFTTAIFLVVTLLVINFQVAFAQSNADWSKVTSQVNQIIAIKNANGKTIYGKLNSANESEIIMQIADKEELTGQTQTFQKNEIKKVWVANLRVKKRGKFAAIGAGIGGGIGLGAGIGLLASTGGSDFTGEILAITTAIGAGAGAALGALLPGRGHQKKELLYEMY